MPLIKVKITFSSSLNYQLSFGLSSCLFLFFSIRYLTMLPKISGKQQGTGASQAAVEENRWEFTLLGFLEKLPKGDPIPMECMNCRKLVECAMAKRAFDWYLGQNSPQTCKPERSRTGKSKHSQQ